MKNDCKKKNQKEFKLENVLKRKGDNTLYVKWKVYNNSFNSWIDKHNLQWNEKKWVNTFLGS